MVDRRFCNFSRTFIPEDIVGEAVLKDFKPISIRNTWDYRLPPVRYIFYIPPQFIHIEKDSCGDYSNRIYAAYVVEDDGQKQHRVQVLTINIDIFRSYHYGKAIKKGDVSIRAYKTADGDVKEDPNALHFSCYNGEFPLTIMADGRSYVNRPFAFQISERYWAWGAPNPLKFYTEGRYMYVKLLPIPCRELREVDIPSYINPVAIIEYLTRYGGGKPYVSNLLSLECPKDFQGEFFIHKIASFVHFEGCDGLTSISVDEANPNYCAIDGVLFNKNKTKLIKFPRGDKRTYYTIPIGVTEIEDGAFGGCRSLTSIEIPDSVTHIGHYAFCGCENLLSVTIPNGVTNIGQAAFRSCKKITSITIPNNVISIGDYAFENCNGLTFVSIGSSVKIIGSQAFSGCTNFSSIYVDGNNPNYSSKDGVLFDREKKTIVLCPRKKAGSYSIHSNVTSIGDHAFEECADLKTIKIPNGVTNIGQFAFEGCCGLTSIEIPNSVTRIGRDAFGWNAKWTSIIVPQGQKARFLKMGLEKYADIIVERDDEELTILLNLAKAYEFGIGVSQNIAQSVLFYTQAAEKGCAEAAYRLAEWYQNGEVLPFDFNKALDLYKQAARSVFRDAETKIEEIKNLINQQDSKQQIQKSGDTERFNFEKAFELYKDLYPKMDDFFHHGSCDGTLFVGPAYQDEFDKFWKEYNKKINGSTWGINPNKASLALKDGLQYSLYFFYIDDNEWNSYIFKYNYHQNKWSCYRML